MLSHDSRRSVKCGRRTLVQYLSIRYRWLRIPQTRMQENAVVYDPLCSIQADLEESSE